MKKTTVFISIILCILLSWDYYNFQQKGHSLELAQLTPVQLNSVSSVKYSDDSLKLHCDSTNDAYLILPLTAATSFWKRLQIEIKQLEGIHAIEIFYQEANHKSYGKLSRKFTINSDEKTFTWYLPPGDYSQLRIDFDGHQTDAKPIIKDISVKEFSIFFFFELYLYALGLIVLGLMILPGSLIYLISAKNLSSAPTNNLLYMFCNSLIFYCILYLFEIAAIEAGISSPITVTIALLVLLGSLFVGLIKRKRAPLLKEVFRKEKKAFITSIFLVLISCMFVTRFNEVPFSFDSVNHNTLDRITIFSNFPGHDNVLQYINGKAIADDEPFSKYYKHKALIYDVQDRGILPGVIYSVYRTFFTTFSSYIGGSYLTYTIVGLCMNIMVIFPLIALFRRYFPAKYQNIFILLLCLNTFVFPNFYFTWFKFSGAALFISGVLLLLSSRQKVATWIVAGLMFGLASGMHAGNALAIPLVFLWFVGLNIYEFGFWSRQVFVFPTTLCIMFVLANLPWSIVKALHFPDTNTLIIQHYFPGKRGSNLGAAIKNFFAANPLKIQLEYRMGNVIESVRWFEFTECVRYLRQKGVTEFIRLYNNYQFFYFMFSVVPLFCIGLLGHLSSIIFMKGKKSLENCNERIHTLPYEALTLFSLSILTIFGLIFIAYSGFPDVNHALPAGSILIIHTLLIGWILNTGRVGQVLITGYAIFAAYRMIAHSILYIFI